MRRVIAFVLVLFWGLALASVPPIVHTETLQVGPHAVKFEFTDWPVRSERSLDIIFAPASGIAGLRGNLEIIRPDGQRAHRYGLLPRYPRDRTRWGLDSIALHGEGQFKFKVNIGSDMGTLPLEVGPRPAGPPELLIALLSLVPIGALVVVTVRAWAQVKPQRSREAKAW
jgi:hypothetical protein